MNKKRIWYIIIAILVLINLLLFTNHIGKKQAEKSKQSLADENLSKEEVEIKTQNMIDKTVSDMPESGRIEVYVGDFVDLIEDPNDEENIKKAYDEKLDDSFKQRNFENYESFKNSLRKFQNIPDIYINYDSIEAQGKIFIVKTTMRKCFR